MVVSPSSFSTSDSHDVLQGSYVETALLLPWKAIESDTVLAFLGNFRLSGTMRRLRWPDTAAGPFDGGELCRRLTQRGNMRRSQRSCEEGKKTVHAFPPHPVGRSAVCHLSRCKCRHEACWVSWSGQRRGVPMQETYRCCCLRTIQQDDFFQYPCACRDCVMLAMGGQATYYALMSHQI